MISASVLKIYFAWTKSPKHFTFGKRKGKKKKKTDKENMVVKI